MKFQLWNSRQWQDALNDWSIRIQIEGERVISLVSQIRATQQETQEGFILTEARKNLQVIGAYTAD